MRKLFQLKVLSVFAMALLVSTIAFGQKPQASPRDSVSGEVAGSTITINYGSPSVRGRTIWGGLVPYDKIWRTGANEATIFTTTKAIKIGGKNLPAGKYSLYSIPGKNKWKFIFNSQTGQWGINEDGSTTDDPSKDVLIITAKPRESQTMNERMRFVMTDSGFYFIWSNVAVQVDFK